MGARLWNKSIAISSALAAAGVLTCAAALLDTFMRSGSPAAFLASMALLGLIVTGAAIGYIWTCDRCESYFHGRLDRLLNGGRLGIKHDSPIDNEHDRPLRAGSDVWLPRVLEAPRSGQLRHADGHVLC